jgi:hypothetical protein
MRLPRLFGGGAAAPQIPASEMPGRANRRKLARELTRKQRKEHGGHTSPYTKPSLGRRRKLRRAAGRVARVSRRANR